MSTWPTEQLFADAMRADGEPHRFGGADDKYGCPQGLRQSGGLLLTDPDAKTLL